MKKIVAICLLLLLVVGCGSDSRKALKENTNKTSETNQDAARENTVILPDAVKNEKAFSFQGGGLLTTTLGAAVGGNIDLFLAMPHGLAANNSELDDVFTGQGGLVDLGMKALNNISEIPLYGYQFDLSPEQIRPGHTYCVRTADGEQYGLFQVIEFDSEAATLKITWRYPAGKPVANVSSDLTQQDVAAIAAQPHEPITDTPPFISAVLKPGIWERTGKVEVQKTPEQEAKTIDRKTTKTIRHAHGKYVVIETTDEDGVRRGTEVHCYDPLANTMHSTFVNAKGFLSKMVGVPDPSTHTVQWKMVPIKNDPRSFDLTFTCDSNGLGAQIKAQTHRDGTLVTIITAELKRIGDLPAADRPPGNN